NDSLPVQRSWKGFGCAAVAAAVCGAGCRSGGSATLQRHEMAPGRSVPRRPGGGGERRAGGSGDLVFRCGGRWGLEEHQRRQHLGLRDSRHIGAIVVDPRNPDVVFVAALGHAFGPNDERGIFRTGDGGKTWQRVLFRDRDSGGIDVVLDPRNPNTLFASLWQMRREPWGFSSGGAGSGLYRSTDGGFTWKLLEHHGLPDGPLGRLGVSVPGADSNRVYAAIEAKEGGVFRS